MHLSPNHPIDTRSDVRRCHMTTPWVPLTLAVAVYASTGCAPDAGDEPVAFCDSGRRHLYDPATALTAWPDDHWTVPDPTTRTGLRLHADPGDAAIAAYPAIFLDALQDAHEVDGFATTASLYVQVDGRLPDDLDTLDVALLSRAPDGGWTQHAHTRTTTLDRTTLFV
ncbi:MAG: hypothetical protein KDA24_28745, partial [Deltaproteobacteria bacterium]|nr:hypothetical protein [Deltaproteobacteria bacterium]